MFQKYCAIYHSTDRVATVVRSERYDDGYDIS